MEPFFNENKYETGRDKRNIFDKLFLNTRWYFVYGYGKVVINGRNLAVKNKYDSEAWAQSSYRILEDIEKSGGRIFIDGIDNISKVEGPVVFVSNHMSTLETFVFPCIIAPLKEVTYVVKESLISMPLFGHVMKSRNPIVVSRKNSRQDLLNVISQGKEKIEKGISIILFPEGTRQGVFNPEKFNSLGIKLAKEAGVPVIPVAIKTDFWGNGKLIKDIGPIRRKEPICISFGEPVSITGNGKAEHKQVVEFISGKIDEFKKIKL
ncbi:lysophospholipid acyltransferase family protein [Ruminiclostridium cellobioparum]|uniref:1-acyl-sn-glycerol-3-phosphate acyltransferase n=1 Tax=Ruminiclostridium cellobioparum subsp. termitidis CT1112 TaxID=1195236 RepID=S0FFY4_RUMCE|nr:lysophospholipid acyltransferase family protein [Ruminiclostridium cellobioparum]EMS69672.1 1-acyl-sn-glycerol-3-phosphate acyltransferase [Ruminiclostridium cellobioparum subsp. termitidis CT1112]